MKHLNHFTQIDDFTDSRYIEIISLLNGIVFQFTGFSPIHSLIFNKLTGLKRLFRELTCCLPEEEPEQSTIFLLPLITESIRPCIKTIRPLKETTRPFKMVIRPVKITIRPLKKVTGPDKMAIGPEKRPVRPSAEAIRPLLETIRPLQDTIRPVPETIRPGKEAIRPAMESCFIIQNRYCLHTRAPPLRQT